MIEIVYRPGEHRVTLSGHAGGGEYGRDLICAGVSTLCYALARSVRALEKAGRVGEVRICLSPGEGEISCTPHPRARGEAGAVFDAVCGGFEMLGEQYPENVMYRLR